MSLQVLHRDNLKLGGFAGIREHRLVVDPRVFGNNGSGAWSGIGNFVYLADVKQTISFDGEFIAYVTLGKGTLNGQKVTNGDLARGNELEFHAEADSQIIIVRKI